MNIFYTNVDPAKCASDHNLRHQVKMIVEHCQMLSTAHHQLDGALAVKGIYKPTHVNHPSSVWIRQSSQHYDWLMDCTENLLLQYYERTGKVHASIRCFNLLSGRPANIVNRGFTAPPISAPDQFKALAVFQGIEKGYQAYLNFKFNEWLTRDKPLKVVFDKEHPTWLADDLLNRIELYDYNQLDNEL